jgi:4-hydroxybenzoate polyprenyltransferase
MFKQSYHDYIAIARPSHWIKNLFIIPGFVAAQMFESQWSIRTVTNLLIAFISTSLIASANYVINEWLDAKSDAYHPLKKNRPSVMGNISLRNVVILYFLLVVLGIFVSTLVSKNLVYAEIFLLFMGLLYNVPPIRLKDKPYLDVISESLNNPIRLLAGWFCVINSAVPPLSIVLGYWLGGAFLMNVKRFAELRTLEIKDIAIKYRKSFGYYTEENLITASLFYSFMSFFFIGIFSIRYRLEYLLITPLLACLYILYFNLGMKKESVAQRPEKLYREKKLIALVSSISFLYFALSFIDISQIEILIRPFTK